MLRLSLSLPSNMTFFSFNFNTHKSLLLNVVPERGDSVLPVRRRTHVLCTEEATPTFHISALNDHRLCLQSHEEKRGFNETGLVSVPGLTPLTPLDNFTNLGVDIHLRRCAQHSGCRRGHAYVNAQGSAVGAGLYFQVCSTHCCKNSAG